MENWFYRKIQERGKSDKRLDMQSERILKDSLKSHTGCHMSDIRRAKSNDSAVDRILMFYELDRDSFANIDHENVLYRIVDLEGFWWKTSTDPMLAVMPDQSVVALIPKPLGGYRYFNAADKPVSINKHNAGDFTSAYNICKPFHKEPVRMKDLLSFMFEFISVHDVLMMILLCLFSVFLGMCLPSGISQVFYVAQHVGPRSAYTIYVITLLLVLSIAAALILNKGLSLLRSRFSQKVTFHVGNAALLRIFNLEPEQLNRKTKTEYWQMFNSVRECCTMLIEIIFTAPVSLLFIIAYIGQLIYFVSDYSWIIISAWLLSLGFVFIFNNSVCKHYGRYFIANQQDINFQSTVISGMEKIQAMHAESRIFNRWSKIFSAELRESRAQYKYNLAINLVSTFLSMVFTYLIVLNCSSNDVGKALFLTIVTIAGLIVAKSAPFSLSLIKYRLCLTEWKRFQILMDLDCTAEDGKQKISSFDGSLSVTKLSFTYDDDSSDKRIIDNINFSIRPNEYVAIVGMSGCGKSTLLKLLIGAETPQTGAILYGSHDLAETDRRSILQKIGVILQDDSLIPGTIRQNLSLSPRSVTEDDMWKALKAVGIDSLVRSYPFGLDTRVSASSTGMSKGQMQRILIARAIISKPKLLIFDEATSALDNIAQREVQDVLDQIRCTRLIVAHRLSTVKNCDRILVMDQGRITEEGDYQTLIRKGGLFAELAKYQRLDI